jgi:hypothetical protein
VGPDAVGAACLNSLNVVLVQLSVIKRRKGRDWFDFKLVERTISFGQELPHRGTPI